MSAGTVLVVDDDASIRLLCRVNLELDGFKVYEADCVEQARTLLAAESIDTVLLDVHVGPESGLELLEEIRRDRPAVSVVLVTGTYDLDAAAHARADAVLGKPFALEDLLSTVHAAS